MSERDVRRLVALLKCLTAHQIPHVVAFLLLRIMHNEAAIGGTMRDYIGQDAKQPQRNAKP